MQKENKRIATKLDLTVCIALACALLTLFAALCEYTELPALFTGIVTGLVYLALLSLWGIVRLRNETVAVRRTLDNVFTGDLADALSKVSFPVSLCRDDGSIVWCNNAMVEASGRRNIRDDVNISELCSLDERELAIKERKAVNMCGRLYNYEGIRMDSDGERYWLAFFEDCTELEHVSAKYRAERTAVAYVVIDNIDELMQYVQDKYRSAESTVEETLKEWVAGMHGILKSYERDKFVMLIDAARLEKCIERRFDILDAVRNVRIGDGMSITVSMGISCMSGSLSDREHAAQAALDMALQRGGDQVVVKHEDGVVFYGGKTKAVSKRTNVRARVVANELYALMARADNILIMGHRFCDFDSVGAAVGVACLAMVCNSKVNIVINPEDQNFIACKCKLDEIKKYDNVFVDGAEGLDLVGPDTLLIIVDVNNIQNVESPDIAHNVHTTVIIDHHRKTAEFPVQPRISYIEPSASSASELVAEILEQSMPAKGLLKEEAELLLSGIMLDTRQFSRNTGARTFGAAQYLRSEGAMPGETQELFKMDVDDITREARFHTNVIMYRDSIAIALCQGNTDAGYRVAAAKAADKLLSVRGVEASFTIVEIEDKVHISARSNGKINVQLILEKLNGGGHFDVAGAQIEGQSVVKVSEMLKNAIDEYLSQK